MAKQETPPPRTGSSATPRRASLLGSASRRVLAAGLALVLSILGATLALMWRELDHARQRDRQHLELLASVLESQSSQVFATTDLALDNLAHGLRQGALTLEQLQAILADMGAGE